MDVVDKDARRTVRVLREKSDPLLMKPPAKGRLKIVGAYYALATGRVDFFDLP